LVKNENVAKQLLGASAGGLGVGLAIAIGTDIFLLGGTGAYVTMVSTGAFASVGLSATA